MILLGVNVDHVATIRQARYRDEANTHGGFVEPDPAAMAWLAEEAGADGITMHVREDRRHVQVEDVQRYLERKKTRLNLEVSLSAEMVELALSLNPESVCLVPENRKEVTTEGGLDVAGNLERSREVVSAFVEAGIPTSMFTVLFAVARTVGWIAQWNEMIEDPNQKIGRPRQLYTGAALRDYVPIKTRS